MINGMKHILAAFLLFSIPSCMVLAQCPAIENGKMLKQFAKIDSAVWFVEKMKGVNPQSKLNTKVLSYKRLKEIGRILGSQPQNYDKESLKDFVFKRIKTMRNAIDTCSSPLAIQYLQLFDRTTLLFTQTNQGSDSVTYFNETLLAIYHTYRSGVNVMEAKKK